MNNKINDLLDLKDAYEHILYKKTSQVSLHIIKNRNDTFRLSHFAGDGEDYKSLEKLFKALGKKEYLFDDHKIQVEIYNAFYTDDEELSIYTKVIEIYNKRLLKEINRLKGQEQQVDL